jgi:hypothetical protein
VYTAGNIILLLKIAVIAVTVLLACSLTALARGKYRLHGRINMVVFALTLSALIGLELVARIVSPDIFESYFQEHHATTALKVHLGFSMPAAVLLPFMLGTGLRHRHNLHVGMGAVFLVLWMGTLVTGVFFLPHSNP